VRKNPLKFAFNYGSTSKGGNSTYVQRDPILLAGRPAEPGKALDNWNVKIGNLTTYHTHVLDLMKVDNFNGPQGLGEAWAVIPIATELNGGNHYEGQHLFDGCFEHAHKDFYGWFGGETGVTVRKSCFPRFMLKSNHGQSDKINNAFNPVFLSYHCNMDRLIDQYLCANPTAVFTSNVPLRPFVNGATELDYSNPNPWTYTTIGDMAKNTACNGYLYARPACPDVWTPDRVPSPVRSDCRVRSTFTETNNELGVTAKSDDPIDPEIGDERTNKVDGRKEESIVSSRSRREARRKSTKSDSS
jgi:hypothetical protein